MKCVKTFVKVRIRTLCKRQLSLLKTSSVFSPVNEGMLVTGPLTGDAVTGPAVVFHP